MTKREKPLAWAGQWRDQDYWEVAVFWGSSGYGGVHQFLTHGEALAEKQQLESLGYKVVHMRRVRVEMLTEVTDAVQSYV